MALKEMSKAARQGVIQIQVREQWVVGEGGKGVLKKKMQKTLLRLKKTIRWKDGAQGYEQSCRTE